jgi:hypothetical protein
VWNLLAFDVAGSNAILLGNTNAEIVNVQDAPRPVRAANITTMITNRANPGFLGSVTASNDAVFIGTATYGLTAISITNPSAPTLLRKSPMSGLTPFAMRFSGTNIIAAERNGIMAMALNTNYLASMRQHLVTGQAPRDIEVVGTTAYLCDRANGLKIYDVSNPLSMRLLGTYDTPGSAYGVAISGDLAFVADQGNGVLVLNVSNPASPSLVTNVAMEHSVFDLQLKDNRLYLAHGVEGVTVWEWKPDAPREEQVVTMPLLTDGSVDDEPIHFVPASNSGLPLEVAVTGPATLDELGMLKFTGMGEVTITVTQAGNQNYAPVNIQKTFTVRDLNGAATANVLARDPNIAASQSLASADADGDGLPNVVEYILRSDPTSASSSEGRMTATIYASGSVSYLKAQYVKPRTLKYPVSIEVTDFAAAANLSWMSQPAEFKEDGTGEFLWPLANYRRPVIRLVVRYP